MRIDILTLFPDSMRAMLGESILGRAAKKGVIDIHCTQIRDYTENKQMQVDDYPYGGGWGCVMMAQPLKSCLDDVMARAGERRSRVIYMSPQGKPFNQEEAKRLVRDYDHLVLVCGHYEGVDERFIEECVDEELSIGDFVLTGGELAAMVVTDCVCRMVPGVLSDEACYTGESHWDGLLEYPQYTRPDVWEGREVPEVLRSGDHAKIADWRRKKQLERTMDKRPDMFEKLELTDPKDRKLLEEIRRDRSRMVLTEPVTKVVAVGTKERPRTMATGKFQWPLYGRISSGYGYRSIFGSYSFHSGLDITGSYGATISAADGGKVIFAGTGTGSNWSYGKYVVIDHENGFQTIYAHCSSLIVKAGDRVYKGQAIARVGSTGRSTGNHCHFQVKLNGTTVNPYNYLP